MCCAQQSRSPTDQNERNETSHSKLSCLFQLWQTEGHQDEELGWILRPGATIGHLLIDGISVGQSVSPSAFCPDTVSIPKLLASHMDERLLQNTHNAVWACSGKTESAYLQYCFLWDLTERQRHPTLCRRSKYQSIVIGGLHCPSSNRRQFIYGQINVPTAAHTLSSNFPAFALLMPFGSSC